MKVGLLLITHERIGEALLETATGMLELCPLRTALLEAHQDGEPREMLEQARNIVQALDEGAGVLVLTDMFGSTPSNVAGALSGEKVAVVAGLNLPMLVRVLNYPQLSLEELAAKALSGGHDGVLSCDSKVVG